MTKIRGINVVVFDVLGTLVNESQGIRTAISEAVPAANETSLEELFNLWQQHIADTQQRIEQGHRAYANTETINAEAAQQVADRAEITDPAIVARLATASRRLPAWDDSVAGLQLITELFPVIGLSNASRVELLHLNAESGLRWHQTLSSETVRAYKPAPEVYQLAIDTADCPPENILMVAAHAWDLRGAQARGMRTAYIHRPVADSPTESDSFDGQFNNLAEMVAALRS